MLPASRLLAGMLDLGERASDLTPPSCRRVRVRPRRTLNVIARSLQRPLRAPGRVPDIRSTRIRRLRSQNRARPGTCGGSGQVA